MKEFKDKVAVVTGAASGIGRALAERCATESMKVVLADVEEKTLHETKGDMQEAGAKVEAVTADVSKAEDIQTLARRTIDAFGQVHLLFNNAGVGAGSSVWESSIKDWQWILGVNIWGIIHSLQAFVPIMLEQNNDCHIVNTSSIAGLLSYHPSAPYQVSKYGVVALSEQLYHDLLFRGTKIKVSVLCPGWVDTNIMDAERNRPPELQNEMVKTDLSPEEEAMIEFFRQAIKAGLSPGEVADMVFDGIRNERFYILTHPEYNPMIRIRMEDILEGRNPTPPSM